ncbi:MAG: Zn-dependent exopeptidase M28 [Treponemataceae bacterium]|nr:Zn-dependent exopeptidase M28 [Treponemataceae bacterium]
MDFLPDDFSDFISENCDRREFLISRLKNRCIPYSLLKLDGKQHICILFPKTAYSPRFRAKTVIVHYDRAENTPGANDNSAAVFQIMDWAERLLYSGKTHNVRIILTDGEELGGMSSPDSLNQGAFAIARMFRTLGIKNNDVYVLDGCGRGNIMLVSTAGKNSPGPLSFRLAFESLFKKTCDMVSAAAPGRWVKAPVPYSDNAGFLANGIPAVALTVLPSEEATLYLRNLQRDKNFENLVMTHKVAAAAADKAEELLLNEKLPLTWRMMHTQMDSIPMLTKEAFTTTGRFLDILADSVTMV